MGKDAAQDLDDFSQHPLFVKVLGRYPDCPADALKPPVAAKHWQESDFEIFVASMGAIVPQRSPKKSADKVSAPTAEAAGKEGVALFECAPRVAAPPRKLSEKEEEEALQASVSPHASGESIKGEPHIKSKGNADASLVIPSTLFMEDCGAAQGEDCVPRSLRPPVCRPQQASPSVCLWVVGCSKRVHSESVRVPLGSDKRSECRQTSPA
ncbi:unnamed protein product, partial [Prorocentrum cordatum]